MRKFLILIVIVSISIVNAISQKNTNELYNIFLATSCVLAKEESIDEVKSELRLQNINYKIIDRPTDLIQTLSFEYFKKIEITIFSTLNPIKDRNYKKRQMIAISPIDMNWVKEWLRFIQKNYALFETDKKFMGKLAGRVYYLNDLDCYIHIPNTYDGAYICYKDYMNK